jgi:hypothetical protein
MELAIQPLGRWVCASFAALHYDACSGTFTPTVAGLLVVAMIIVAISIYGVHKVS